MTKRLMSIVLVVLICSLSGVARPGTAADFSGTWTFSVDLDSGGHGDPTFVFKQEADKLTGTYSGPVGEHKVTGTVTGDKAVFGFEFSQEGQSIKVTYSGTLESAGRMTGTVEFSVGQKGKWTASRKAQ